LLANLLHASSTLETLENNQKMTLDIIDSLLGLINEDNGVNKVGLPTSTLIHLLICLYYIL
jgi:hypothetical protein